MLTGSALIFALVVALLVAAFVRRQRDEATASGPAESAPSAEADGPPSAEADGAPSVGGPVEADERRRERVWIIGLGLGFTMTVLATLLAFGLTVGERLIPGAADDVVRVHAEARRWRWDFAYDDRPGLVTVDVLHIPAGRPVDVAITSVDVVHSFWVPRLAGKLDAIPGHVNVLRLEAEDAGVYAGVTAEFNGARYREHVFAVVAHEADAWRAIQRSEVR
jgi:cytochrome c oxidase subunit 2/cytochrome aa3-600 menaquinol oxidase subunit 2